MTKEDKKEEEKDLELEDQDDLTDESDDTSTDNEDTGGQSPKEKTDWKKSYQGLQRTTEKKQKQIGELSDTVGDLTEQIEALKLDKTGSEQKAKELEEKLEAVSQKLKEVTAEKGSLDNTIARQKVILESHPTLAPFMKFIPEGDSLETFESNAKEFAEALGVFQEQQTAEDLEGASPPPPGGDETVSSSALDKAWDKVSKLAGVRGKEAEYDAAYEDYLRLFDKHNKQN